ncbi:MAG: DNA repair protein RecO [Thermodesulfobacteriota bacterium]
MRSSEAFMLRKSSYGEADYILTLFTREFGKLIGLAKNAKKSTRRFGGRLEPFVHFRVRFRERKGSMHFIEDCETIRVFRNFMEDVKLFSIGCFLLENVEILFPVEERNESAFELLISTLSALDANGGLLSEILKFQLSILALSGFLPNLDSCIKCGKVVEREAVLSIKRGGLLCANCNLGKRNGFMISKEFLLELDTNGVDSEKLFSYIDIFRKFSEYYIGKEIKSFKYLGELCINDQGSRIS